MTFGKVSVSGTVTVNGEVGTDTFSLYDATIGGTTTFNGSDNADTVIQYGTTPSQNVIGGDFRINPGGADDVVNLSRLSIGSNLIISDPNAITGSTVTLTNVRTNLDVTLNLTPLADIVLMQGEDNGDNRFQVRSVFINTGNGKDTVTVNQGVMVNLIIDTGAGDEGNGEFGVRLTNLAINTRLRLDTGVGIDNVLLDNISVSVLRVFTGANNDGIIAQNITSSDAIFDTGDSNDEVGLYNSLYTQLLVTLGDGNDSLFAGALTVTNTAKFVGGGGLNTYQDNGGNFYNSLTRVNI